MSIQTEQPSGTELHRMLWRMLPDRSLPLSIVSGLSGDRDLTEAEKEHLKMLRTHRKQALYSDILFTLTHQWFDADEAERIWSEILKHKYEISAALGRNVRVTVAAVDYLYNLRQQEDPPSLVDERSIWNIAEAAVRDSLTTLYDLPTLCMHLDAEIKRSKRYGTPVSVIIGDVDDFKRVNDRFGHQHGDAILRQTAGLILECVRDVDICTRWGGEEFAILLPQTDHAAARISAERIRVRIEESLMDEHITISQGVASCPEDATTTDELVEKADKAMYRSKRAGKNRVTAWRDTNPIQWPRFRHRREHPKALPFMRNRAETHYAGHAAD